MDRRRFLSASGAVFLGVIAAACSGGSKKDPGSAATGGKTIDALSKGKEPELNIVPVQPNLARPDDRLALALLPTGGSGAPFEGGTARAWVARTKTEEAIGPVDLVYHGEGFDRGVYVGRASFATEGQWLIYVEATPKGASKALAGGSTLLVGNPPTQPGKEPQPVPGDKAISVATPTVKNARGVNPICTRVNPTTKKREICPMHEMSLDAALGNGKPTVLTIGTPAFCQSRFCGPIVDQLMTVKASDLGAEVNFVHIELYADDKDAPATAKLAPAAAAWRVEAEPAVYYIKADGTIADWTIGASDAPEMRALTQTIL